MDGVGEGVGLHGTLCWCCRGTAAVIIMHEHELLFALLCEREKKWCVVRAKEIKLSRERICAPRSSVCPISIQSALRRSLICGSVTHKFRRINPNSVHVATYDAM